MKTVEIVYRYGTADAAIAPRPADAGAALDRLNAGNQAFGALIDGLTDEGGPARRVVEVDGRDLGIRQGGRESAEQRPFAAILGCADARVPVELVFNEGPNDLFVVRVAGNVLGTEVLGSLRYAVEHLGGSLKVIAVLGHSGCGAVSTAVDVFLKPASYLPLAGSLSLRSIVDRLLVVVQASAKGMTDVLGPEVMRRSGYRAALIEVACLINAALAAHTIQQEIGKTDAGGLRAVYGAYLLDSHRIWAPQAAATDGRGLASPPADLAAFHELGKALIKSERITTILEAR